MLIVLLIACAMNFQKSGLVAMDGRRVRLADVQGSEWRLRGPVGGAQMGAVSRCVLHARGATLQDNDHCPPPTVQVSGTRLFRQIWVHDWTVIDAGDGSAPFMGTLQQYGSHWRLDDELSGSTLLLVPESVGRLSEAEGHRVLVVGYVVGAHQVHVLAWTSLSSFGGENP